MIFPLRIHQVDVGLGFAPDPTVGAYSAPPDPLAGFKGPLRSKRGMEGRTREGIRGRGSGEERGKGE